MAASGVLNNREIAALLWLVALIFWFAWNRERRRTLLSVVGALTQPILLRVALLTAAWTAALVAGAERVGVWDTPLLKDTIVWFGGAGLGLLGSVGSATDRDHFFRRNAGRAIRATMFVEVFVNLVVLPLPVELLLVPVLTLLLCMSLVAAGKPDVLPAKRVVDGLASALGLGIFVYVSLELATGWSEIDWAGTAEAFSAPLWLTLGLLPFVYALGVYSSYQIAFGRIDDATSDRRARLRAKMALLATARVRARDLGEFRQFHANEAAAAATFDAACAVVRRIQVGREEEERATRERAERLERYVGVAGVDDDGRQLDQREFEVTREALDWIASCQIGWYRNRGRRYRRDLLAMLEPFPGLPEEHGITLEVTRNGGAWWAWRRTITGWCLGIGANGSQPKEWVYDAPEPPRASPGHGGGWHDRWSFDAVNWEPPPLDYPDVA